MLPHDVLHAVGQGSSNGRVAPRMQHGGIHRGFAGSLARLDARHGLLGHHHSALSSSGPRPMPATGLRGGGLAAQAHATSVEAPASAAPQPTAQIDLGYARDLEAKYAWGKELGKGGNGLVRVVTHLASGEEFACKAIRKVLAGDYSAQKKAGHVDSIRREVEVLRRLAGSLNIVRLVDVFEDEENVYLVQELCKGGELWHRIGERHYSERTVASFMRAVLRTLAQCHSHHILHRDVKPGNFMLLDESERSPLKAIDFGLAVPYDPAELPRHDLGLEGTPWFMAPEVLSSSVTPASDVWSAGVMAFQLLTGRLPFDDHRNPFAPSISAVWRSVLTDSVDFNMPWWKGISDEAKDFVHCLLNRDPHKRPSAKEALKHPWLQGNSSERSTGKQIDVSVVARIQRFAQNSRFKRSVLRLIAEELLARPPGDGSAAGGSAAGGGFAGASSPANGGNPVLCDPAGRTMTSIYEGLSLRGGADWVDRASAAAALASQDYRLEAGEAERLLELVDTSNSGRVRRAAVAASQLDWRYLQQARMAEWLDIAARAFASLDTDSDGRLSTEEIMAGLRAKLAPDELAATLRQAMAEAGQDGDADGMDFDGFLRMLRVGSVDSLDQYDARWGRLGTSPSLGSIDRLQALLDASTHGGSDAGSVRARGLYAGLPAAAPAPDAASASAEQGGSRPAWQKPMVNFKFDFGNDFIDRKMRKPGGSEGPPETQGAPGGEAAAASAIAAPPAVAPAGGVTASSYFNNGAVRGGCAFDKRMHGASLYRNAVVGAGLGGPGGAPGPGALQRPGQYHGLASVKE